MTVQQSVAVRNAKQDAFETAVGASPILRIRTGVPPANCAASRTGTILVSCTLPADWMGASSGGVKALLGTWSGTVAAAGTAGMYEIMDAAGTTCHEQGTVTATGGGGDLTVDNVVFAASQPFSVSTFAKTAAGA